MKLFLSILTLCLMINVTAMDLSQQPQKLDLGNAIMGLVGCGKNLVVYYNDGEKPTKDYSTQIIKDFRNNQSLREHISDYVVNGPLQYESKPDNNWHDTQTSIDAILSTKKGLGFYRCGFVLYTTQSNESFAFDRYMIHVESLRRNGVPVIIYAHDKQVAEKIFYHSLIDSADKDLIINGALVPFKKQISLHHQRSSNYEWVKLVPVVMLGSLAFLHIVCLVMTNQKS